MALVASFLSSFSSSFFCLALLVQKKDLSHPSAAGPAPVAMATAASLPSHPHVEGVFTPRRLCEGFLFVSSEVLFYFTLGFSVHSTALHRLVVTHANRLPH